MGGSPFASSAARGIAACGTAVFSRRHRRRRYLKHRHVCTPAVHAEAFTLPRSRLLYRYQTLCATERLLLLVFSQKLRAGHGIGHRLRVISPEHAVGARAASQSAGAAQAAAAAAPAAPVAPPAAAAPFSAAAAAAAQPTAASRVAAALAEAAEASQAAASMPAAATAPALTPAAAGPAVMDTATAAPAATGLTQARPTATGPPPARITAPAAGSHMEAELPAAVQTPAARVQAALAAGQEPLQQRTMQHTAQQTLPQATDAAVTQQPMPQPMDTDQAADE